MSDLRLDESTRRPRWGARTACVLGAFLALAACGDDGEKHVGPDDGGREPCADYNPLRNLYFGDLHVHTGYSFDAYAWETRATPADAYRFARGEEIGLPPLGAGGSTTRTLRLRRPLDFTAVTDHSEFLGEIEVCTVPGSPGYESETCRIVREEGALGQTVLGFKTVQSAPTRFEDVCGEDGGGCLAAASEVWRRTVEAANSASDQSEVCSFTALVGYEYTANTGASTRHRNVIFRSDRVPFPASYFEQPTPRGLWTELKTTCLDVGDGCDVLAIPHNSNESNGNMFFVEYPGAGDVEAERSQAEFRALMEPLVEIYQHKGDSECTNGLGGAAGEPDEFCDFEKMRRPPFDDCGDGTGSGGGASAGCVSRLDFARGALLAGLAEAERIGVNPYRLGFVAATDTHNATAGATDEDQFSGHHGTEDDAVDEALGQQSMHAGPLYSPGGLTAVWAEENSRASLFDALRRREVYGTSGPRITVRVFGGWDFEEGLCAKPDMVAAGYARGVPMGALLPVPPSGAASPTFLVSALRDPGAADTPGVPLERLQMVKGWIANGEPHHRVFEIAGDPNNGASVDPDTCVPEGEGFDSLCAVWSDPEFDATQRAFYYVRVLENPSCRWTAYACNALPPGERPEACTDPEAPKILQERAWTSPIWFEPDSAQDGAA